MLGYFMTIKFEYLKFQTLIFLENEKSFWSEVKNIFPNFTKALFYA